MPEMHFQVRWPDGREDHCYSPSLVVREHLQVGDSYPLPDFMRPHALPKVAIPAPKFTAPALDRLLVPTPAGPAMAATPAEPTRRLVCARCAVKISFPEGKFCWNNAQQFGGLAYCREHQALM